MYSSDKKYDTILISQVLEHLKRPQIAIKCMAGLLKDGGTVICTSPFVFAEHGEDYFRYTEMALRMMFGTYFSKVSVIGYGNFISAAWQCFNFHNKFWVLNRFVAWLSRKTFSSKYVPDGFITVAIK
jgi:SAM-dependent methyltransferase